MSNNRIDISRNDVFEYDSKLIYITYSKYENDWISLRHFHPFTEIFYVVGGKGTFTAESITFDVKKHDLILVNPNVYHNEDSDGKTPLEYVVLGVKNLSFSMHGEDSDYIYQNFEKNSDIQYYVDQLLEESHDKAAGYEMICQKLFDLFLLKVLRQMKLSLTSKQAEKPIKREINMICQYIDQRYDEDITLDSMAELMKMNKYYMAHEFKRVMGISPINYLIERRIKECKSQLTTTSLSIAEISATVGFSSQSYFSQIFKKKMGMTPKQYRDQNIVEDKK